MNLGENVLGTVMSSPPWWLVLREARSLFGKQAGGGGASPGWKPALGSTLAAFPDCVTNSASINTRTSFLKSRVLGPEDVSGAAREPDIWDAREPEPLESPERAILSQVGTSSPDSLLRAWHLGGINQNL